MPKIFKINLWNIFSLIAIMNIFTTIITVTKNQDYYFNFILMNTILLFLLIVSIKTVSIEINNSSIRIKNLKWFFYERTEYQISKINLIEKKEKIGRFSHQLVLQFMFESAIVSEIGSYLDGWEKEDLVQIKELIRNDVSNVNP